jgi:hypothetical protein
MKPPNPVVRTITRGFRRGGSPNWLWISGTLIFGAAQIMSITIATRIDKSWFLSGGDKGLFQHYGAIALLITDPLLLVSASYAYSRFRVAMSSLPLCNPVSMISRARRVRQPYIDFLHMRGRGFWVYMLFVSIGLLSWLNNLRQTSIPRAVFGHDVFDSTSHISGFIVYKMVLFNSWVVIYPLVGFFLVGMGFSTRLILERLQRAHMICPNVLHPDGCYGLSELGTLNICLLLPYLLAFTVIFGVVVTHEVAYASLVVPLFGLSFVFVVISYVTIKPILALAKAIKRATYKRLAVRALGHPGAVEAAAFALERLCFGAAKGSPYSPSAKMFLLTMRVAPVAVTTAKYFWSS